MDYKIYRTPCNAAGYIVDSKEYGRYAIEAYPKSVTCVNGWDEADKLLDQDELNEA